MQGRPARAPLHAVRADHCSGGRPRSCRAGRGGVMAVRDLIPAERMAGLAAIHGVDDHIAGVVALESHAPEHAYPPRRVAAVDQYRPDPGVPEVVLEAYNPFRARLGEPLHRPRQVAALRDGLVDIAAGDPHVETGLNLPEHAGVADSRHHDDRLPWR